MLLTNQVLDQVLWVFYVFVSWRILCQCTNRVSENVSLSKTNHDFFSRRLS